MKPYIYPYQIGSHGARALAESLETLQVRPNGRYVPKPGHKVINWGNAHIPGWWGELASSITINKPQAVANAIDKIRALQLFNAANVPTLEWTTDINIARGWFGLPCTVVCRTLTRASEGRGIVVAFGPEELVSAPLYTKYKRKQYEYRIHCSSGKVFDMQMKRRKNGLPPLEGGARYIRNTANGWVFCRQNINVPEEVKNVGLLAVASLGLDFGAVDIGLSDSGLAVYEVNTAPGLEGQTLTNYVNFLKEYING